MYQYLDRSVSDLAPGDALLVWAMRQWVAAMRGGRCPCAALGPALAARRLGTMLPDFNIAMMLLDREGVGELQFRAVGCLSLGDDEALLLALHAAAAKGQEIVVQNIVEALVKPEAQRTLRFAATRIAQALAA
ncbi:hypothetical protein FHS95_003961 [Sphingomonas naasensis]|uniref:Uncharacterized protein n=1 Tax=Sphingomonas naasensis TaxID=1344951 RepID=A0A4S1WD17_9SPHN|nr:hypothetical protein [Sphingomonas naasensis]NIJ22246.1 hypothetical protein [Sphingomonas naasensis]TGX40739.1 hypothetical protein E5A74_14725 [Sphingomonas naasensis]